VTLPYNQEPHLRYLLDQCSVLGEFFYDHAVTAKLSVREDETEKVVSLLSETLGISAGITVRT